jgi:aconitate hydratase
MAQKIALARAGDREGREGAPLAVDQVVLAARPNAVRAALDAGLKKLAVETAVVYEPHAVGHGTEPDARREAIEWLALGAQIGRAGIGFAGPVHLERFASPARLVVTDDARLACIGGVGALALVLPTRALALALATGRAALEVPRSVHVVLSGRTRPFVGASDVALELVRRGVGDVVKKVAAASGAPVVLEFGGAGTRLLSVGDRAVLCDAAPALGAAGALFASDERTEVFLRDQRRSKAHRALTPDPGAPFDEVCTIDLAAVDPLLLDEKGKVRGVREVQGRRVSQVVLGGAGVTLRDLLSAAALLKSKRCPPAVDLLVAVPTRQMLEVLAAEGALTDLVATGARFVEPDRRLFEGTLHPPLAGGESVRTAGLDPDAVVPRRPLVVSPDTLAFAAATGEVGDPRGFKRPVRVSVPLSLPTDDVLVLRDKKALDAVARAAAPVEAPPSRRALKS